MRLLGDRVAKDDELFGWQFHLQLSVQHLTIYVRHEAQTLSNSLSIVSIEFIGFGIVFRQVTKTY